MQLRSSNPLHIKSLLLLVLLFAGFISKATDDAPRITMLQGNAIVSNAVTNWIEVENYGNTALVKKENEVTALVMLQIDEKSQYIQTNFIIDVPVTISYVTVSGASGQTIQTFSVEYKKESGSQFKAKDYFSLKGIKKIKLQVGTLNVHGATWNVTSVLTLKAELRAKRDYVFNPNMNALITAPPIRNVANTGAFDEIKVSWSLGAVQLGCTHYDLEWAWLDKEAIAGYYKNNNASLLDADLVFTNNASRVTIDASRLNYSIPLYYDGVGYLVYRIRPVQINDDGTVINGTWSVGANNSIDINGVQVFTYNGHEPNLNWQASTTFAEDGKHKTVIQYYDGSLRARQTVTKDNETGNTIVAETFYDYQGRPSIQVLPAPTINTVIQYARNFNQFEGVASYPKDLYDFASPTELCIKGAPKLVNTSGASKYYSANNDELTTNAFAKFIPDAVGYPYTETRYTPDNTGRIAVQGGVGAMHQIGGVDSKATKYFYGSADQQELDALFGTEVGNASHYFKNMVRDANGQYSVSYVDMHGRTIATALAGTPPANLKGLASYDGNNLPSITQNLLGEATNIVKDKSIEATKTILVPTRSDYTFTYSLDPEELKIENCNNVQICYDCIYDLEITIHNQCGNYVQTYTKSGINITACNSTDNYTWSTTFTLDEGEYDITKRLTINQASFEKHEAAFIESNTCKSVKYFSDSIFSAMNGMNPNCKPTCAACTAALGSYANFRSNFLQQVGYTGTPSQEMETSINDAYNQAVKDCQELCTPSFDRLKEIRLSMIADLTPITGQYATIPIKNGFSIFGNLEGVSGVYIRVSPNSPDPESFAANFQEQWGEQMLQYHPEFCKLTYAEGELKSSFDFENHMQDVETYADAKSKGWITANLLNIDPFFSGPGSAYASAMLLKLNNDLAGGYSMWQVAYASVFCQNADMNTCISTAPKTPPYNASSCAADWDRFWLAFRSMYISERDKFIDQYLSSVCTSPNKTLYLNQDFRLHFISANDFTGLQTYLQHNQDLFMHLNDPYATYNDADAAIRQEYKANCESNRDAWQQVLESCPQINTITDKIKKARVIKNILDGFVDVCTSASNLSHPYGASNNTTGNSFEKVMTDVFANESLQINAACNPYMIDWPKPYDKQPAFGAQDVVTPNNSCVCDKLTQIKQAKTEVQFAGTLSEFIQYQYGTYIRQGTLDTLLMGCAGTYPCNFLNEAISLPPVLQCTTPLEVCISCYEFKQYKTDFNNKYGTTAPIAQPANDDQLQTDILFARFINYKTGFGKTWMEYLDFENACSQYDINNPFDCKTLKDFLTSYLASNPLPAWGTDCKLAFVAAFNTHFNTVYTFTEIQSLYLRSCGKLPEVCLPVITCEVFDNVITLFNQQYPNAANNNNCQDLFVNFFNQYFGGTHYLWSDLAPLYTQLCRGTLDVCNPFSCIRLNSVLNAYTASHNDAWMQPDCANAFALYFNNAFYTGFSYDEIEVMYSNCGVVLNVCTPPFTCDQLTHLSDDYKNGVYHCTIIEPNEYAHCTKCFTAFVNESLNINFSYLKIVQMFKKICGSNLDFCGNSFDCDKLTKTFNDFIATGAGNNPVTCKNAFTNFFNSIFGTYYSYAEIIDQYVLFCGKKPALCDVVLISNCDELKKAYDLFMELHPHPREELGSNCITAFTNYVNTYFGTQLSYDEIMYYFQQLCGSQPDVCGTDNCGPLQQLLNDYNALYNTSNLPLLLQQDHFVAYFNQHMPSVSGATWLFIVEQYANCGIPFTIGSGPGGGTGDFCNNLVLVVRMFNELVTITGDCRIQFTRFFNKYYGVFWTYDDILHWLSTSSCPANLDEYLHCVDQQSSVLLTDNVLVDPGDDLRPPRLCGLSYPLFPPVVVTPDDPCKDIHNFTLYASVQRYETYQQQLKDEFENKYLAKCLAAKNIETFTVTHKVAEYHYTLYYYDQSGSLVKTVPPQGVKANFTTQWLTDVADDRSHNRDRKSQHTMVTQYRYNTLNQVIAQLTPDGGENHFWYDRLGRLVVSQNAKQKKLYRFSYTCYDALGRITEVGEKQKSSVATIDQTTTQSDVLLKSWLFDANPRFDITRTIYDDSYIALCGTNGSNITFCQYNLRNRVSYTMVLPQETGTPPAVTIGGWSSATFYTYDIHGNVGELLQNYRTGAMMANNQYKKIQYKYDLVSGKVNEVKYQDGFADAFYHRYEYDAENKLTAVRTSKDYLVWDKDATYNYYKHGPLARMTLGENQVQGVDYAYTLQGWLKGVNATASNNDMGADGIGNGGRANVARDAYGYSLNYFDGDYKSIGSSNNFAPIISGLGTNAKQLFNGNIAVMAVNIPKLGAAKVYNYGYDQLNRIVSMDAYDGLNTSTTFIPLDDYKERITYDANGNILTYKRNGNAANLAMDDLRYSYYYQAIDVSGNKSWKTYQPGQATNTAPADLYAYGNRLAHVKDAVSTPNLTEDLESQPDNNYAYDEIGNLTKDAQEGITNIDWNVYGKIKGIVKTNGTVITYSYDASGNRVSKNVNGKETWYVRDASGNVMALYTKENSSAPLKLTESHLYGSSRLGVYNRDVNMDVIANNSVYVAGVKDNKGYRYIFERGYKFFELSNHLGNVLVTITDRTLQYRYAGSTALYYEADVSSASDYAPGGMLLVGRSYSSEKYRFGFNGQERTPELGPNTTTAEYWQYDARIVRRWNLDPVVKEYESPYLCFSGNPVLVSDLNGNDGQSSSGNAPPSNFQMPSLEQIQGFLSSELKTLSEPVTVDLSNLQGYFKRIQENSEQYKKVDALYTSIYAFLGTERIDRLFATITTSGPVEIVSKPQPSPAPQESSFQAGPSELVVKNGLVQNNNVKVQIVSQLDNQDRKSTTGLIFHRTQGATADGAITWWSRSGNTDKVGAHFIIDANGTIYQTGNMDKQVNHCFGQNRTTIGVEFTGTYDPKTKTWQAVTAAQVESGTWLFQNLMNYYNIPKSNLYNHEDKAKKEPGEGATVSKLILPNLK